MKVILLERIGKHGHIGDEVTVKDGYARNFLLPQHKALRATEANRKKFEVERASIEKRNAERREAAAGIAAGLNGQTVVIIRQAGETGQLYGSVSSRDVAEALSSAGFTVARSQVVLADPITQGQCNTFDPASGTFGEVRSLLKENNLAWRLALDWSPSPDTLLYASVSRGYKSGTTPINAANLARQNAPVKQEKLTAYEVGLKATLADRM
ncbi:MAG: 50S ribosomal protein L9, partial [Devosia sp.]|nr:50S ribosomal protein L9 [Devosia sp.]